MVSLRTKLTPLAALLCQAGLLFMATPASAAMCIEWTTTGEVIPSTIDIPVPMPTYCSDNDAHRKLTSQPNLGSCPAARVLFNLCESLSSHPINYATGNKFLAEQVFGGTVHGTLQFNRFYNSMTQETDAGFGFGWRHNYHRKVVDVSDKKVLVVRGDGQVIEFVRDSATAPWRCPALPMLKLESAGGGWRFTDDDDTVDIFAANGRLEQIKYRGGRSESLKYETVDGVQRLIRITDNFGRKLRFRSQITGLQKMWGPANLAKDEEQADGKGDEYQFLISTGPYLSGGKYSEQTYRYDRTLFPDGSTRRYLYGKGEQDWYLIKEQLNSEFRSIAQFDYDMTPNRPRRALSSQLSGGVEKTVMKYEGSGNSSNTDSLGRTQQRKVSVINGLALPTELIDRDGSVTRFEYHANGLLKVKVGPEKVNGQPVRTEYAYDPQRHLLTSEIEAAGTALARETKTVWHPQWNQPKQIIEPDRVTELDYDTLGNLKERKVTAAGKTLVWRWEWDSNGLMTKSVDPAGLATTYKYDAAGNLLQMTDPQQKVTVFAEHNASGFARRIDTPDGVSTRLVYDVRNRVRERRVGNLSWTYEYDGMEKLLRTTFPDQTWQRYEYDAAERLVAVVDSAGNRIDYELDSESNIKVLRISQPNAQWQPGTLSAPVFLGTSLPGAMAGLPYQAKVALAAQPAATVTLAQGNLPAGLTLAPDGTLSGQLSAAGNYQFTLKAKNAQGEVSASFSLNVSPLADVAPTFSRATNGDPLVIPAARTNERYVFTLHAGGSPAPRYALKGTLPKGLIFDESGVIYGTPTELTDPKGVDIQVTATNRAGQATYDGKLKVIQGGQGAPGSFAEAAPFKVAGKPLGRWQAGMRWQADSLQALNGETLTLGYSAAGQAAMVVEAGGQQLLLTPLEADAEVKLVAVLVNGESRFAASVLRGKVRIESATAAQPMLLAGDHVLVGDGRATVFEVAAAKAGLLHISARASSVRLPIAGGPADQRLLAGEAIDWSPEAGLSNHRIGSAAAVESSKDGLTTARVNEPLVRLGGAQLMERFAPLFEQSLGLQLQAPQQNPDGRVEFGLGNGSSLQTQPVGMLPVDPLRQNGVKLQADGSVELSTDGVVTRLVPVAHQLDKLLAGVPGSEVKRLDNGTLIVKLEQESWALRPDWTVLPASGQGMERNAEGLVRIVSDGRAQTLWPAFADWKRVESLIRTQDAAAGLTHNADGSLTASVNGRRLLLQPDYRLIATPAERAGADTWQEGDTHYVNYFDGHSQGFKLR
ncbi:putative Ig domain-containing protein [Chitinimonas lacunae]|uniref:Ig domain-containing protein n=1 Tax=Chitinimonas lacunae TaxID=1963018 RepID=A0ABV8MN55_9NEIS